jgi:NADPH2:quinone reductase
MTKAILFDKTGGPEVLRFADVDVPQPGPGEVRLRHTAIGLNFLDTYYRSGLYPSPSGYPLIPGSEAAGRVVAVGEGVTDVAVGDRVAYVSALGAYAEERVFPADKLVKIPDGVSDEQAAAAMLKGLTVEYLLRRTYPVKPGDVVLYHAAAGGVGLLFGQWAKHIGATAIGTAGSPEKVELARAAGFDHVIDYSKDDFVKAVGDITGGRKCDVVYDSVGKDTYMGSLDCLKPRGLFVSFGQSSGPIPPFNTGLLAQKGSLYLTRPTLFTYIAVRAELDAAAAALFDLIARDVLTVSINQRYALADTARAHSDLEARRTTGVTLIVP